MAAKRVVAANARMQWNEILRCAQDDTEKGVSLHLTPVILNDSEGSHSTPLALAISSIEPDEAKYGEKCRLTHIDGTWINYPSSSRY